MTKVVLQPCGEGSPAQHYRDTVEMPVPLTKMAPFLSTEDIADFQKDFPSGRAAAWGVTPGGNSVSEKK